MLCPITHRHVQTSSSIGAWREVTCQFYLPIQFVWIIGTVCVCVCLCVRCSSLQLTLAHGSGEAVGTDLTAPRFLVLSVFWANFFNFARSTLDIASGCLSQVAPAARICWSWALLSHLVTSYCFATFPALNYHNHTAVQIKKCSELFLEAMKLAS